MWPQGERAAGRGTSEGPSRGMNRASAAVSRHPPPEETCPMDIVRNDDGTLVVPVEPERPHATDDDADASSSEADREATEPTIRILHPGEGGYDEALAEWDLQQNPDRPPAVSTASGRQEAMDLVHAVANSADHAVAPAVAALADPNASGGALRHALVGGVPSR